MSQIMFLCVIYSSDIQSKKNKTKNPSFLIFNRRRDGIHYLYLEMFWGFENLLDLVQYQF